MIKELPPSLWAETAPEGPDCPPLAGPADCDVAIVGGGYTGLSAALHLAEAGWSVRLLEAGPIGYGASGRNGGQVNPGWKADPDAIHAAYGGGEAGRRAVALAGGAPDLVFDLIRRHAIDCEAVRPGYIQAATDPAGAETLARRVRRWETFGASLTMLGQAATAQAIGTDRYGAAMLDPRGGNLQPLAYARGLARAAVNAGAVLHADSQAQRMDRDGAGWWLATAGGSVRSRDVLLCTNGYTDGLWPGLARSVVPVASCIAASEPLSSSLRERILPERHAVSDTARAMLYFKRDAAGRLVIGARGRVWSDPDAGPATAAIRGAQRLFPDLRDVRWTHQWGGYVAITPDHWPRFLRPAPGVLAALGYNGRGVAMGTAMGREIAHALLGERPALPITDRVPHIPFHRFRRLGIAWHIGIARLLDALGR